MLIYGAALPSVIAPALGAFVLATLAFQAVGFLLGSAPPGDPANASIDLEL
jgi:hypothetical protein